MAGRLVVSNPFAESRTFHKIGHLTNTQVWKIAPTPEGLALLTTTGRKTGMKRDRAIRAVRVGMDVFAVALLGPKSDWFANIRANPNVQLKLGGTTHDALARTLDSSDELERASGIYNPVAGWYDYVDYANLVWSLPTRSRLLSAHDEWFRTGTPVVFELRTNRAA